MYIFELFTQLFKKKKVKSQFEQIFEQNDNELPADEDCNHFFMPIDSTNTMFACKYCGLVVPKEKLKDKNIFKAEYKKYYWYII